MSRSHAILVLGLVLSFAAAGCADKQSATELAALKAEQAMEQAHLENFDDLDFNVFSGQKWDELSRSHSKDIVVHWPDGHTTTGIDVHIQDLKNLFTFIPDMRIKEHPIKIAQGDWTSCVGIMEGTFSAPMTTPDGQTIQPTGKAFKLEMCTVGHWKDGVMTEEYLFWDNHAFMQQIGLAQ